MTTRYQITILTLAAFAGWVTSWAITQQPVIGAQQPVAGTTQQPVDGAGEELPGDKSTGARHYSYAIGMEIGSTFRKDQIPLEVEGLLAGLRDGLAGVEPKFDVKVLYQALQQLNERRMEQMVKQNKQFLVKNRDAPGVQVTQSGLQYKVLAEGDGPSPSSADVVRTHYRGTLVDGTEFDSSYARGEPATFPVRGVIPAWTEALQLMKVGDKWQLFIPSELAYGAQGAGDAIPPHATLLFEIELLGIEKK